MALTRRLIEAFLRPNWLRTDPMLAHARLFSDDFAVEPAADGALAADLRAGDAKMHDYYCYVLLDFAVADRDLEEAPLAAALILGDDLGLGDRFRQHPGTHRAEWNGRDYRICEPGKNQ